MYWTEPAYEPANIISSRIKRYIVSGLRKIVTRALNLSIQQTGSAIWKLCFISFCFPLGFSFQSVAEFLSRIRGSVLLSVIKQNAIEHAVEQHGVLLVWKWCGTTGHLTLISRRVLIFSMEESIQVSA